MKLGIVADEIDRDIRAGRYEIRSLPSGRVPLCEAADLAHRWGLGGLIVFSFHKPGATEANAEAGERAARDSLAVWIEPICWGEHARSTAELIRGAAHPEWVAAGEGMIDYRAHFARLRQAGFDGSISLEPHLDGSCKEAVERAWLEC
ncbi:MAG TPA: hypothetical protein VG456_21450 [Candidatus Sulfopaludibacter sp.]|jgi:hypothetical protein|nr:hypothetical protein [Candidatus Sulfopaludibacter sp.]